MNVVINVLLALIVASLYVSAVHMFRPAHLKGKDRNNLQVIHYRLRNVSVVTLILCIGVPLILNFIDSSVDIYNLYKQLGILPLRITDILWCLIAISVLYCGPIFDYTWNYSSFIKQDFKNNFLTIYGFRDHIFAPITEELIYRSVITVILSSCFTKRQITIYSPLLFGIAHIHHGYEMYHVNHIKLTSVLLTVSFQTLYTSLFGMLSNYVLFKYQSVWCSVIIHSMCNLMGFPSLVQGSIVFQLVYYLLLLSGLYLFYILI